jgi:hypothetical protein
MHRKLCLVRTHLRRPPNPRPRRLPRVIRHRCRRLKTSQPKNLSLSKSGVRLVDPNDDQIGLAVNVRSKRKLLLPQR